MVAGTNRCLAVAALGAAALFSGALPAQSPQKEEKPPLRFEISVPRTRVCLDTASLYVTARLTNTSAQPVRIDPDGVWYRLTLTAPAPPAAAGQPAAAPRSATVTAHEWLTRPERRPRVHTLNPGRSYRQREFQLLPAEIITAPGLYKLKLTYGPYTVGGGPREDVYLGPLDSNELALTFVDCRK